MPDWFEMPNWFVLLLAGAVIAWLINRLMPALSRWAGNGLRRANHWRKFVIGAKRTRAAVISRWKNAPPWVLSATLFRWFEADPQAWCGYVKRVYDSHNSEAVRESARGLLWVDKTVADLQVGDVYYRNDNRADHVLALHPRGDWVDVVYKVGFSSAGRGSGPSGLVEPA